MPVAATVRKTAWTRRWASRREGLNGIDQSTGNKEVGDTNADDETSSGLAGSLTGLCVGRVRTSR